VWESPFSTVFFSSLGSTSSGPGLSGRFMVVATELGGGEARECVDSTEPWWLLVCMEGEGEGLAYW
jgi:hypothetical protein